MTRASRNARRVREPRWQDRRKTDLSLRWGDTKASCVRGRDSLVGLMLSALLLVGLFLGAWGVYLALRTAEII